jgi:hypothetical protein
MMRDGVNVISPEGGPMIVRALALDSVEGPGFEAPSVTVPLSSAGMRVPSLAQVTDTPIEIPVEDDTENEHPVAVPRFRKSPASTPKTVSPKLNVKLADKDPLVYGEVVHDVGRNTVSMTTSFDSVIEVGPAVVEEFTTEPTARDNCTTPSLEQVGRTSNVVGSVVEVIEKLQELAEPTFVTSLASSPDTDWLKASMKVGVRVPDGVEGSDHVADGIDESIVTVEAVTVLVGPALEAASTTVAEPIDNATVPSPAQRTTMLAELEVLDETLTEQPGAVPEVVMSAASNPVTDSVQVAVAEKVRDPVYELDGTSITCCRRHR